MRVLYGLRLATGSVAAIQRRVSEALGAPVAEAERFVRRQIAQYVDETGWRECGQLKWLWVNATREVTTFEVLDGRGAAEAKQVISPAEGGIVTTDRYRSYDWLAARRRQVCSRTPEAGLPGDGRARRRECNHGAGAVETGQAPLQALAPGARR